MEEVNIKGLKTHEALQYIMESSNVFFSNFTARDIVAEIISVDKLS